MLTVDEISAIEAINLHLDEQPGDWDARRILADLYMDANDEDRARTQMWLVDNKRAPEMAADRFDHPAWVGRSWAWWSRGHEDDHSVLYMLAVRIPPMNYGNGGYSTRQEAEDTLMDELIKHDFQSLNAIRERIKCGK